MQVTATGMAWYEREDWLALKALFTDSDKLHASYDDWLAAAELGFKHMTDRGQLIIKVPISPEVFAKWCKEKGLEPNAHARSMYASLKVRELVQDRNKAG